jgi:hypothetical protein
MPSIEISFSTPAFVVLLLILAAGTLSWFFYRTTLPAVARPLRLVLGVLRGLALALLCTLLCAPLLRLVRVTRHPPVIAVLADRSASMGITDRNGSRAGIMMRLLGKDLPASIPGGADVRYWTFGVGFSQPRDTPPDSITCTDELTDLAGAIRGLARVREQFNLQAAVLLTDGVYTVGDNPYHDAGLAGIPLFAIGIGDTAEQKDVLISRVAANDLVFAGTPSPVDVTLKSNGFTGERADVTLTEGSRVLGRAQVTLPPGTSETPVELAYTPESEGSHRYTVVVSPRAGELTAANNTRSFTVRVLKSKLTILLLAGNPGPDLTVVRQTLIEDPNLSVTVRTQKAGGGFYEGTVARALLDSADCLVTIGMPTSGTPAEILSLIRDATATHRVPLLFIDGSAVDRTRIGAMAPSLPVAAEIPSRQEQEVDFVPAATQVTHPILAPDPAGGEAPWSRMPPLFTSQTLYRLREGSIQLGSPRLHNVLLPQPLMACRNLAGTRSVAILGYGLWRWRLMAQAGGETARFFPMFLSAAVSWLTSRNEGKNVRVVPEKDVFARGERIGFSGQVYTSGSRPVENAQLRVTVSGADQAVETELRPIGSGRYEGEIDGLAQGEYTFRAAAFSGGSSLGTDAGTLRVGGLNLEFLETRMNAELLQQIAYRTGGKFFTPATAGGLRAALDSLGTLAPREERHAQAIELPHWPTLLAFIILLLAAEWIVRKRSGML